MLEQERKTVARNILDNYDFGVFYPLDIEEEFAGHNNYAFNINVIDQNGDIINKTLGVVFKPDSCEVEDVECE